MCKKSLLKSSFVTVLMVAMIFCISGCYSDNDYDMASSSSQAEEQSYEYTDMELINMPGHPVFYDDKSQCDLWKKIDEQDDYDYKIYLPDEDFDEIDDEKTILMLSNNDEGKLWNISFYPINIEHDYRLFVEDVMPILIDYLPKNVIKSNYSVEKSNMIMPIAQDDPSYSTYYYTVLTKKDDAPKDDGYPQNIWIYLCDGANAVEAAEISSSQPRELEWKRDPSNGEKNIYGTVEWEYNILDHLD